MHKLVYGVSYRNEMRMCGLGITGNRMSVILGIRDAGLAWRPGMLARVVKFRSVGNLSRAEAKSSPTKMFASGALLWLAMARCGAEPGHKNIAECFRAAKPQKKNTYIVGLIS